MLPRFSLSLKLSAAFFVMIVFAVTLVYFLTERSVVQRFDAYRTQQREENFARFGAQLAVYYEQNGSWVGVDRLFYSRLEVKIAGQVKEGLVVLYRHPFSFANEEGRVILSTEPDIGRMLTSAELASGPILVNGSQVGTLLLLGFVDPDEAAFLAFALRSALIGGGITTAVAVAISVFLIAQILSPLRALTRATESIAQGRTPEKVLLRSRDEIGQLGQSFDHMVDNLRRSEELRQTMTADIAHELRTPVTIIQGTLEAVLDGVYEPTPETIAPIYEETLHLGKLIDDLRELAMAEAGELRLEREEVDVGAFVRQIIDATVPALEGAPTVRTSVHGDPTALVDPKRFRQIIANLLGNAMRYTPSNGFIDVDVAAIDDEVEISVSDTGPGISPGDLEHLFERFFRGDASRSRAVGGSGLGLAIVKQWVEAHGGRVWAENRPEGGARFTFRLPLNLYRERET
jgi:signal transduction histidine kinase